jgi:hypothetical protein
LRWLLSALGRQRWPEEKYFFIKFDCWHAVFLPLMQRAFPGVPWIFIYREPVEVLMSHARQRGAHMIPRVLDPGVFGWDDQYLEQMALDEYGVRVLGRICEAALEQARLGRGKLRQLPGIVWPDLMKYWGVDCAAEAVEAMTRVSRFNAKNPVLPFEDDTQFKRRVATEEIRRIARQWLNGTCEELEARRLGPAS